MVLGDRTHLSKDLRSAYRAAGLSHVLVVSGMHVSILCGSVFAKYLPEKKKRERGYASRRRQALFSAAMALLLAEEVESAGIRDKLKLRKVICGSEIRSEKMRLAIESKLGLESSYDIAGMTEMYGPGTAIDCDEHNGLHYWADMFIIEILDPETLQPVPEGEVGEMVVTSLRKEAVPLLRYRTHDLSRLLPGDCPCGLSMPRHDRILGRSDDMIIYRGVNIYPGQIMDVIGAFPELGGEYHVELTRDDRSLDHMTLTVERAQGATSGGDAQLVPALEQRLHKSLLARVAVKLADHASLPRTFSKSKRVTDLR